MYIEKYDNITGNSLGTFSNLNFNDLVQNQHSFKPTVFRLLADSTDVVNTNLSFFLSSKGAWADSTVSYYNNPIFIPSIESGDLRFNFLSEVSNPTIDSFHGITLTWNIINKVSDYVWLDVIAHKTGTTEASFSVFWS